MESEKSVITINEYGKINIRLKEIMVAKNMTRNHLARASHTRFEVINKWYNNEVKKMDLDILARICYVLLGYYQIRQTIERYSLVTAITLYRCWCYSLKL